MDWLDPTQHLIRLLAETLRVALEGLSVLSVLIGLLAMARLVGRRARRQGRLLEERPSNRGRLTFGTWLSLALEFQLGADIVATTITPSGEHLIQLGAVAVIRTLLNLFLGRELEQEQRLEERGRALAASA
jgi:uncharacterized membrane protein